MHLVTYKQCSLAEKPLFSCKTEAFCSLADNLLLETDCILDHVPSDAGMLRAIPSMSFVKQKRFI